MDVREATAADWPAVSALLAELGRPDVRGASDEEFHRGRFEDYVARPDTAALVAVDDGDVVGFIDEGLENSAASFTKLLLDVDWPPKPR